MFDTLSDRLQAVFGRLGGRARITEKDLDEALREVRVALLEADVNFKVVRQFINDVREKAVGADVIKSVTPVQQVIAIVNDELVEMLGGEQATLAQAQHAPTVIVLAGLKGAGKTTTAAKLAQHLRKGGARPYLASVDRQRVAGAEQLASLARQLNLEFYSRDGKPHEIARDALKAAEKAKASVLIVDTQGYVELTDEAQAEIKRLHDELKATETLLVADAMTGQEAVNVAQQFQVAVGLTGLILTKVDSDARGGAALSIRAVTGVPIKFVGTGEKTDALEPFYPDRFASRILGMGDVVTLVEKAQETIDQEQAQRLEEKLKKGSFDLQDFVDQLQQVRKMGPLGQIMGMLPGFGQVKKQMQDQELDESQFKRVEAIIYSMTPEERRRPEVLERNGGRRRRVADGSGTTVADVNRLLKQFAGARRLMEQISSGKMPKDLAGMMSGADGQPANRVTQATARRHRRR
ncbi:MAG TPA: signal recognition particle protein [Dehalococcoidia bacterium]|nr:signal recognition particle protein [Dehalococcoidia bacterium]